MHQSYWLGDNDMPPGQPFPMFQHFMKFTFQLKASANAICSLNLDVASQNLFGLPKTYILWTPDKLTKETKVEGVSLNSDRA